MKKALIIYLPNGNELKYPTVDLGDNTWTKVENIIYSTDLPSSVSIKEVDDDQTKSFTSFVGIPFQIESWD